LSSDRALGSVGSTATYWGSPVEGAVAGWLWDFRTTNRSTLDHKTPTHRTFLFCLDTKGTILYSCFTAFFMAR
jgi:hypothetical protein